MAGAIERSGLHAKCETLAMQKAVMDELEKRHKLLRADVADEMRRLHAGTGADRVTTGAGTVSASVSRGGTALDVVDAQAYANWCLRHGFFRTDDRGALAHFEQTGEVPDGAEPVHVPGGEFRGIRCTASKEQRASAWAALGGMEVRGLLEGVSNG